MDFNWSKEQLDIAREIRSFAINALNEDLGERDQKGEFSLEAWKKCSEIGILGLPAPEEYQGAGCDILTTILALENFGYGCRDNGLTHSINSHLWGCEIPILKYGSDRQKNKYLPGLCKGDLIGAHAVTEPDAGSDVFALKTSASKEGDEYVLNGSKSIVSNGPIADIIVVFAVTDEKSHSFGKISGFIIEKGTPGVSIGKPLLKMGLNTSPISEMFFDECRLSKEHLLGKEGQGSVIFNETMAWERTCLFACHIGAIERTLEECIKYAKARKQFGQPIGKNQSIAHKIADMKVNLELGRLILYKAGWMKSKNMNVMLESAIAKLFVSESLKSAMLDAVQLHGSYGYMAEMGIERELRDSIAATIYSGTSEIQKNIISAVLGL